MRTKATCRPEPFHIRRFTKDKLPVRCKRLKPIDLFDEFSIAYARHALDAPFKQTGKARRVKTQDSGIDIVEMWPWFVHGRGTPRGWPDGGTWNGVNIEGGGIALVPANHHALSILAKIDQLIGIAQIGNTGISRQFGQWAGHGVLVLHGYKWDGDTSHTPDTRRPDTCCHNHKLATDASLRRIHCLHTPIADVDAGHAGVSIEGCPTLLCIVCHGLCQDRGACGTIGGEIQGPLDAIHIHQGEQSPGLTRANQLYRQPDAS